MYELIKSNSDLNDLNEISFETNKKGILIAYNHISDEDAVYISAPKPILYPCNIDKNEIAESLSINISAISNVYPVSIINAGLNTLIVPISSFNDEISMYPDIDKLRSFTEKNNIDIVLIWCNKTADEMYFAHTRVFAPKFGYLEDPATGSGNSAFANYLKQNSLWDGTPIAVEQGGDKMNFNRVMLRISNGEILFGGSAKLKIEGIYYL